MIEPLDESSKPRASGSAPLLGDGLPDFDAQPASGADVTVGGRVRFVAAESRAYIHAAPSFQLEEPMRLIDIAEPQDDKPSAPAARTAGRHSGKGGRDTAGRGGAKGKKQEVPATVLVGSRALFREDCFDIESVPEDQVHAVDSLTSGILPEVREFLKSLQLAELSESGVFPEEGSFDVIERLIELDIFAYTGRRATTSGDAAWQRGGGEPITFAQSLNVGAVPAVWVMSDVADEQGTHSGSAGTGSQSMRGDAERQRGDGEPIAFAQSFMRDLGVAEMVMAILRHICNLLRQQRFHVRKEVPLGKIAREDNQQSAQDNLFTDSSQLSREVEHWSEVPLVELTRPSDVVALPANRTARLVCELCYTVLVQMVHKHEHNSSHVATFLGEIQDQLLLLEILADNEALLQTIANDATKTHHIAFHLEALVTEGKDPMHLRFLSSMAAVSDKGIEPHQDKILPHLLAHVRETLMEVRVWHQAVQ
ncbi:hypothetical protein T484DRAFT_1776003, partial [Baffinella frigidus]